MSKNELAMLVEQVNQLFGRDDVPAERKREANEKLNEIRSEVEELTRVRAVQNYIAEYMQSEKESFQSDSGERSVPLCSCANPYCDLKMANIPAKVSMASAGEKEVAFDDWVRQHSGDAAVIKEAREKWNERRGEVKQQLREILILLTDRGEVEDGGGELR